MDSFFRFVNTVTPDFSVLFWASKDLLMKVNPYLDKTLFTGVGYPPNTLLFYFPFALFPYQFSQNFFFILSFLSLIFSFWVTFKILDIRVKKLSFLIYILLALVSFPTRFTFGMGQNNFIVLPLILLSYYFFQNDKKELSGMFLGLAISFKTIFAFFLLFYLLKREWKIFAYSLLTILLSVLLTGGLFGWSLYSFYLSEVIPPLLNLEGREIYYNQGIFGFISRIVLDIGLRRIFGFVLSALVGLTTIILSLKKRNTIYQFSLFFISLLLIDSLSWQHHFVWLIFPFVFLSQTFLNRRERALLVLLTFSYLLVSWNFKVIPDVRFASFMVLSHVFIGTILLFILNIKLFFKKDI